jgi:hypothetical protein
MTRPLRFLPPTGLLLAGLLLLAACDSTTPDPDDVGDGLRAQEIVFTDASGALVAHSHDDHWHGTIRATVGRDTTLLAYVVANAPAGLGHDVPPRDTWVNLADHPDHTLRVTSDNPAVAQWSGDRHALTLSTTQPGGALTTVVVLREGTTLYQSPPAATLASAPAASAIAE